MDATTLVIKIIEQAKMSFYRMKSPPILASKRALGCCIKPITVYGCETWTISKQLQFIKETESNRNVVLTENAMNLMDCKEIKRNEKLPQQDHSYRK